VSALVFERRKPLVSRGGDAAEYQVGDASWDARWTVRLSDGTWAVVTQTFYLADFKGRRFVESQVEYLVCTDPADPGGTELASDIQYIDHGDDVSDDPRVLAEQAVDTTAAEWREYRPAGTPAA
jgi:hypothetical protein